MALFLVVAGLTGSILAFDGEIRDWLNPPSRVAVRAQPMLDPVALRERALALAPLGQITSPVSFRREPGEAYTVSFEPRTDPATGKPYALPFNTLTLDPYTGDEIGRSQRPESLWPITRQNFISVIIALHYRLAVPGSIGTWLFGIAALIWTLDCFVGFYLTLPTRRRRPPPNLPLRKGEGNRYKSPPYEGGDLVGVKSPPCEGGDLDGVRQRSWWARWKLAWLVKWRGSAYRINFDLHRAGGLWLWIMLLVLAWSSVGFNLSEQVYMPTMKAAFNMPNPYGDLPTLETPLEEPRLDWREAHAIGQRLMAEQARIHGFNVQREDWMSYDAAKGVFFYGVRSDRDVADEGGSTWLVFDGNSGHFAGLRLPSGLNAGSTLDSWIFALHMAIIWGLPYKIFLCLVGILITMLSITGIYIWLRKRRAMRMSGARRGQMEATQA